MDRRTKIVCVLGMGRSGTSALAKALRAMGVYFGRDEDLVGYEPIEHSEFRKINDAVLKHLDCSYDRPKPELFHDEWSYDTSMQPLMDEAGRLVKQDFGQQFLWGWKTPSTTIILPFWQSVLKKFAADVRYVIMFRDPIEVAYSYRKFRQIPIKKSLFLWQIYNALALKFTKHYKSVFVFYDELLHHPVSTLEKIALFIGNPMDIRAGVAVIDREKRNNLVNVSDTLHSPLVSSEIKIQYMFLLGLCALQRRGGIGMEFCEMEQGIFRYVVNQAEISAVKKQRSLKNRWARSLSKAFSPFVPVWAKDWLIHIREGILWS